MGVAIRTRGPRKYTRIAIEIEPMLRKVGLLQIIKKRVNRFAQKRRGRVEGGVFLCSNGPNSLWEKTGKILAECCFP